MSTNYIRLSILGAGVVKFFDGQKVTITAICDVLLSLQAFFIGLAQWKALAVRQTRTYLRVRCSMRVAGFKNSPYIPFLNF